jgi:hypothetical protein
MKPTTVFLFDGLKIPSAHTIYIVLQPFKLFQPFQLSIVLVSALQRDPEGER